jgi:hypothetical protein
MERYAQIRIWEMPNRYLYAALISPTVSPQAESVVPTILTHSLHFQYSPLVHARILHRENLIHYFYRSAVSISDYCAPLQRVVGGSIYWIGLHLTKGFLGTVWILTYLWIITRTRILIITYHKIGDLSIIFAQTAVQNMTFEIPPE